MKPRILLAVSSLVCTVASRRRSERYTVNQSLSMTETRYQEVMNALAVVAASRGQNLPSYSLTTSGLANVTATVSMDATTTWAHAARNFSQQILNLAGKHTPELSWTLDPVADPTLLEGAWYACHWAIYGPPGDPTEYHKEYDLLRRPTYTDIIAYGVERDYHLGVFDEQHPIPCGWLGVGPHHCVPHGACYTAHCGDTYVWVMPDQVYHLSEFTLVLLDIATTVPAWYLQQKNQAIATVELGMPGSGRCHQEHDYRDLGRQRGYDARWLHKDCRSTVCRTGSRRCHRAESFRRLARDRKIDVVALSSSAGLRATTTSTGRRGGTTSTGATGARRKATATRQSQFSPRTLAGAQRTFFRPKGISGRPIWRRGLVT